MRSKTTSNLAIHHRDGWRQRLGCCQSRRLTPLGLILMLFALFVPNIASAQTKYYSFNNQGVNEELIWSDNSESGCTFFTKIGNTEDPERFAMEKDARIDLSTKPGLYNGRPNPSKFLVANLYAGEEITFNISTTQTYGTDAALVSDNATKNGNTFTMKTGGSLIVTIPRGAYLTSINIVHQLIEAYGYDPAIEIYNLSNVSQNIQNNHLSETNTGFKLDWDDYYAKYLTNLNSGLALNNRIAISQVLYNGSTLTPWTFDGGLKSQWSWHNISICNLIEGDRVRITYTGSAKFSSKGENSAYNGCAAFKDVGNNGDFILVDGDAEITCGMTVEQNCFYTITEDGHLDIALSQDSKITKIEIYGDHQAQMTDEYNGAGQGYTSYFDQTGQLEAKHHIVPGGLHVYVGNDNNNQHAEVVMSDKGPVSFVYDQNHFKMARHEAFGSFELRRALPVTGTFYKFVPDVDGTMTVRLKANSINYRNYNIAGNASIDQNGTPNEVTNAAECPYYLMKAGSNDYIYSTYNDEGWIPAACDIIASQPKGNGHDLTFANQHVEAGQTYYIYGWWDDTNDAFNINSHACGVAELLDVTFVADNYIYPLAKWVKSGTEAKDLDDLADVTGYTDVCIKKKSDNIESVSATIEGGKLKITNISYKSGTNPGGVVLIKVGDRDNDADPVFVLTIAYDAGFNSQEIGEYKDSEGEIHKVYRSEGHTWNFSDNSLNGLKWEYRDTQEATVTDFGTHFNNFATADKDENGVPTNGTNGNSFLTEEINKGDWTFNYRVRKNGKVHDPRFLNNYDMEGDNADMMWDTEGLIINAGSTQSCIFNEFNGTVQHNEADDPDRYVGFLPGGEFIIPKLNKGDRVIVFMGSGEGSGTEAMEFHITNALDAMHNPIDPSDSYHVGGSQWNIPNSSNKDYHGCYHFYAADDDDMKFTMSGGSMCKLYKIKIYTGEREETNAVQEDGGGYTVLATKAQNGTVTSGTNSWTIHYRGKGETIADGNGKFNQVNQILAHSGSITHYANTDLVRSSDQGVSYTNPGEIGMLRVRVKCMEYNHNYVTDYADRNITLALHETKVYPYTWDFTDINRFSGYGVSNNDATYTNDILGEYNNYPETTIGYDTKGYDLSCWNEDGTMIIYGPTWGYTNQNMIFENSKGISGNQLYANGKVIPETQGLWFYMDNNDKTYEGSMKITADGLRLANIKADNRMGWWNYKTVVPDVPAGAAVYARVSRVTEVGENEKDGQGNYFFHKTYRFDKHMPTYPTWNTRNKKWELKYVKYEIGDEPRDDNETSATWEACRIDNVDYAAGSYTYDSQYEQYSQYYEANDGSGDYIIAIYNWGETSNLILTLNGFVVKKLAVSLDPKTVNKKGWTTESRSRVIDPELTAYLTGYDFETCLVTGFDKDKRSVTLSRVYDPATPTNNGKVMRQLSNGQNGANIIHFKGNGEVKILKGTIDGNLKDCFHLFVPDMHDYIANRQDGLTNLKSVTNGNTSGKTKEVDGKTVDDGNYLVAQVSAGTIGQYSTRPWFVDGSETTRDCTNYTMSYRYFRENPDGSYDETQEMEGDEAFYRVAQGGALSGANKAYLPLPTDVMKVNGHYTNIISFVYEGEETGIQDVTNYVSAPENNVYYTIDGQKLNGVPTIRGIYIVNGKKVVIK